MIRRPKESSSYFLVELNVGEDGMNPPGLAEHRTEAEGETYTGKNIGI